MPSFWSLLIKLILFGYFFVYSSINIFVLSEFLQKSVFKKVIEELKEGNMFQPYKHLLTSGYCIILYMFALKYFQWPHL